MEGEGQLDLSTAKAEARFVRDEAFFLYRGVDSEALRKANEFVDRLKVEKPKIYRLGLEAADLLNEVKGELPETVTEENLYSEVLRKRMDIENKSSFKINPKKAWKQAVDVVRGAHSEVQPGTWDKYKKWGEKAIELKEAMRKNQPK